MASAEELAAWHAAMADVVADAENLLESLDEVVDSAVSDNVRERWAGWRVPVDSLRAEANRIANSLLNTKPTEPKDD